MNEGKFELTRDEVKALAGEVLDALGVERNKMDEGEREVLRKAVEEWRRRTGRKGESEGI